MHLNKKIKNCLATSNWRGIYDDAGAQIWANGKQIKRVNSTEKSIENTDRAENPEIEKTLVCNYKKNAK